MKHRFIICLLLLCGVLSCSAGNSGTDDCSGDSCVNDDHDKGDNGDDDDGSYPYSLKMFVKRQGEDLYISAKMDAKTDITYWFKRCMFNELYTFYRVGMTGNTQKTPTSTPEDEPKTVLNLAYSDNIGPFAVAGSGWTGGNHAYREGTARTAYNESFSIRADGRRVEDNTEVEADLVTIEVENVILDPTRPYQGDGGDEELRDILCRESVKYTIWRNSIEVAASHTFYNQDPVKIAIYYGMQSMFEGKASVFTSAGKYNNWTGRISELSFLKRDYPDFRRFVEKNGTAYQSSFLLPDGLGDHEMLGANDVIFIGATYGKSYHKLIADKTFNTNDKTFWRGVYTWFTSPLADDGELLCYEGVVDGRAALFIDAKKACERTLKVPSYLDASKYEEIDSNGGIRVSAKGRRELNISADGAGGCVLVFTD